MRPEQIYKEEGIAGPDPGRVSRLQGLKERQELRRRHLEDIDTMRNIPQPKEPDNFRSLADLPVASDPGRASRGVLIQSKKKALEATRVDIRQFEMQLDYESATRHRQLEDRDAEVQLS